MSIDNQYLELLEQVRTQLRNIKGGTDYNFNIPDERIILGWKAVGETKGYPSLYVSAISGGESVQTDQITYTIPVSIEIFGYIKTDEDEEDVLKELSKLYTDIETAIYSQEKLGGNNVYELSLSAEMGAMNPYGVVVATINAMYVYERPLS